MNYIINPIWFYVMSFAYKAHIVWGILIGVFGVMWVIYSLYYVEDTTAVECQSKAKKSAIAVAIAMIVFTLIPTEESCKEMIAASLMTKDTVFHTEEEAREFVDCIVDKIEEVQGEVSD